MIEPNDSSNNRKVGKICLVGTYMCVFFTLSALFLFFGTLDNIDVDGSIKTEFQQYEGMINCYCILGLLSIPFGLILGIISFIMCKINSSLRNLALFPIIVQGLFLVLYLYNIIAYFDWGSRVPPSPTTIPINDNNDSLP